MGNISSREAENLVDSHILRLARFIDSVLRSFHRKLSTVSSFFFSRVFGYDVVLVDDSVSGGLTRKDSLVCGPGNVCIVPANRLGPRQEEKRRRSERRRRAEAAAMGEARLRSEGWTLVGSAPNSPIVETREKSVRETLGEVARAPPARPAEERETVAEREKGKLWVMGNVPASKRAPTATKEGIPPSTSSALDQQVWQRMHAQRSNIRPDSTVIKRRIQPRQSSKSAHSLLASPADSPISPSRPIEAVSEKDEMEVPPATKVREEARVLPPGALSLGASPWEPCFSNPFTVEHEQLPTNKLPTTQPSKPQLSIDTHLPPAPAFISSPVSMESEDPLTPAPGRRPSASAAPRVGLARRSFDASSLHSVDSHHSPAAIDVKLLATAAVHEAKGRRVWKGEVNKAAMQHCLSQQNDGRRFSMASPTTGALARVRSQDAQKGRRGSSPNLAPVDGRRFSVADKALVRVKSGDKGRRGSSPALNMGVAGGTGLRVERPQHGVAR